MRKHNQQPYKNSDLYSEGLGNYNIDQNYKKNVENNNVVDLITHKEKQIDRKKYKLGTKAKKNNNNDQFASSNQQFYQFEDENSNYKQSNLNAQKQMEKQSKQKLLQVINKMMAKNKINSKTAFQVPILSIQDFGMYDQIQRGDFAWTKMSTILENDYKIYGVRVDSIAQFVRRMSDSLCRKQIIQENDVNEEKQGISGTKQKQQKTLKYNQILSSEVKTNLMLHLERNSQNLDINLKKKLMMRKDPLFERTSRKFDHSSYSSFFMNTLSFSQGLFMQINASQTQQIQCKINIIENSSELMKQTVQNLNNIQLQSSNKIIQQKKTQNLKSYTCIQSIQAAKSIKAEIKFRKSMQKYRKSIQKFGLKLLHENLPITQQSQDYQIIINMIMKGQLKSAFEVGIQQEYQSQQDQVQQLQNNCLESMNKNIIFQQNQNQFQDQTNNKAQMAQQNKKHQQQIVIKDDQAINKMVSKGDDQRLEGKQFPIQNIQDIGQQQNNIVFHIQNDKCNRKIRQVIKITQPKQKVIRTSSRNKQIKNIVKIKATPKKHAQKVQKQMFDASIKQNFRKVIKKQKIINIQENLFEVIIQRNLMHPLIQCNLQMYKFIQKSKNKSQLRPIATKQELKKQRKKLSKNLQDLAQEQNKQQNNNRIAIRQGENNKKSDILIENPQRKIQQQSSQEQSQQQYQNQMATSKKNQTITKIKQNIYTIVKSLKVTNFANLKSEYNKKNVGLSPATIFIGMLHLANQKYIKVEQMNRKNFKIRT